jgi:glycine betaine/proline transport system substrate-binding protein
MLKTTKLLAVLMIAFAMLIGCSSGEEENKDSKGTITFGVTPWTSTVPPTTVAKLILEDMGYTVEEISADAGGVYAGMARGDIDAFMDAWLPDMHANYMKSFGNKLTDTAISYPDGELGWVVPQYMTDINSIDDIVGNEDIFDGKIYGIEEGAGMTMTSRKMIEAYGLDLQYVASSEGGMMAQASKLLNKEEPVLFIGWRPHPMFANYDLKVIEDPKGYFKTSEVHVITNKGLEDRLPEAFEFLSNWSIDVNDIEQMIVEIDNGKTAEEVAQKWIDNNQDKVNEMLGK